MKSSEEFWNKKKFGPSSNPVPGSSLLDGEQNVDHWLLARQRIGKFDNFIRVFLS